MTAATRQPAIERYIRAAKQAGCPPEQLRAFVRAGYVAQPKQLQFHAAARLCDAPDGPEEIGYGGARGPGKSHAMLAQIGLDDCQRQPGLKALILRKVGKAVRESVEDMLPRVFGLTPYQYNRSNGSIAFGNGSRILLGHYKDERDVDNYLGLEYDVIGIEEATTLSAKKIEMIGTCLRTSKPAWRPRMYSTTNPGGIGHGAYKRRYIDPFRAKCETLTRFVPATVEDNRFVNPEYRRRLDNLVGWELKAWRYGDWDIAAGQYFTTWRVETHVIPHAAPTFGTLLWLAMDYGRAHWTAVYLMAQVGDRVIALDEYAGRRQMIADNADGIYGMLSRNGVTVAGLRTLVAGHDIFSEESSGQTIADAYAARGLRFTHATIDRLQGASAMLQLMGDPPRIPPRFVVSDRCVKLIATLPEMQHDPNRPEDVLKVDCDPDTGEGGDDPYDAVRYGVMAAPARATWGDNMKALSAGRPV